MNSSTGQILNATEVRRRALTLLVADLAAHGVPADVLLSDVHDGLACDPAAPAAAA